MPISSIIPQPIRALYGLKNVGTHETKENAGKTTEKVAEALVAVERIAFAAAALYSLYRLNGSLSYSGFAANKSYSGVLAAATFVLSPTICSMAAGSLLVFNGGKQGLQLIQNASARVLNSENAAKLFGFLFGGALLYSVNSEKTLSKEGHGPVDNLIRWNTNKIAKLLVKTA